MREAYRVAKTGRPGPVVVDFYRDVVENQKAPYIPMDPADYCYATDCVALPASIQAAAAEIKKAKKPCLWVGNGVKLAHAEEEIKELSLLLAAPIVTTYNAMAAVESSFENLVGPRTRHGSEISKAALEESDCVITVGSTLTAISTNRWDLKIHNMIQFDIIPENIGRHYPAKVGVVGDAKAGLRSLLDTLKADGYQADPSYRNDIFARKAKWAENVFSGPIADVNATPVPPIALHMELSKCLKENSIFVVDAGNPGASAPHHRLPRRHDLYEAR